MAETEQQQDVEKWMETVGTKFCDVHFFVPRTGEWWEERHVDDHDTFLTTVEMTASRINATSAMWADHDGPSWFCLTFRSGETRTLPSREAAEMVAIHVR